MIIWILSHLSRCKFSSLGQLKKVIGETRCSHHPLRQPVPNYADNLNAHSASPDAIIHRFWSHNKICVALLTPSPSSSPSYSDLSQPFLLVFYIRFYIYDFLFIFWYVTGGEVPLILSLRHFITSFIHCAILNINILIPNSIDYGFPRYNKDWFFT